MLRSLVVALALAGWLFSAQPARADNFTIDLEAKAGKTTKKAKGEEFGFGIKPKLRGVLEAKAGKAITVKWTVIYTGKKYTVKDVIVHLFVAKEDKAGQPNLPKLGKKVNVESALTMDFQPDDKSEGETTFRIDKPGVYMLRVQTIGAADGVGGHEHFAALDLVIK